MQKVLLTEIMLQGASRAHHRTCEVIFKVDMYDGVICMVKFIGGIDNVGTALTQPMTHSLPLHGKTLFHKGRGLIA